MKSGKKKTRCVFRKQCLRLDIPHEETSMHTTAKRAFMFKKVRSAETQKFMKENGGRQRNRAHSRLSKYVSSELQTTMPPESVVDNF